MNVNKIYYGDSLEVLRTFPDESIDCCVTSPPYWALRDYGEAGQLGLEKTYLEYIEKLCVIFDEVKRVLKKTGTCWVNLGDTYNGGLPGTRDLERWPMQQRNAKGAHLTLRRQAGVPKKSLCQIPSRFAIAMTDRGWILRNEIIWHKPNCMPQSVKDRFTVDFEKIFFFTKTKKYFFDQQFDDAKYDGRKQETMRGSAKYIGEVTPGHAPHTFAARAHERWQMKDGKRVRNKRAVWAINIKPYKNDHFATFPESLVETPIRAGCPEGGVVLDPFMGAGTTALVAKKLGRQYLGIEINSKYIKMAKERLACAKWQRTLPL